MLCGRAFLYTCWTFATLTACGAEPAPHDKAASPTVATVAAAGSGGSSAPIKETAATPLLPRAAETPAPAATPECAGAKLNVTRVIPTVWLMIDGSGSMAAPLDFAGPSSRWSALREILLKPDSGLVSKLQSSVAFGLYVYDGGLSLPGIPGPQCPRVVVSEPTLDNAAAMSGSYPELETGASTPTHYALLDLKQRIDAAGPSDRGPTYVVLATDGMPNVCDFHDGLPSTPDTEAEAIATVQQLAAAGTGVFVISMAGDDAILQAHLTALAAAGGTGTAPFTPASQADLESALTQIIGATASCDLKLQGIVEAGRECTGTVTLNGTTLVCNAKDGYKLKANRQSLELLGEACKTLQTAAAPQLEATFPCDDVTLL